MTCRLSLYPSLEVGSEDVELAAKHSEIRRKSINNDSSIGRHESFRVCHLFRFLCDDGLQIVGTTLLTKK